MRKAWNGRLWEKQNLDVKKKYLVKCQFHKLHKTSKTILCAILHFKEFLFSFILIENNCIFYIQPVSYKRYFRCNNCFLLLVYTINLSLRTDLVEPPPMGTFYMKHALCIRKQFGLVLQQVINVFLTFFFPPRKYFYIKEILKKKLTLRWGHGGGERDNQRGGGLLRTQHKQGQKQ